MLKYCFLLFFSLILSFQITVAQKAKVVPKQVKTQPAATTAPDTLTNDGPVVTEQEAEDMLKKQEKSTADTIHSFKIIGHDISYLSVCPGTTINIPFTTVGPFDAENTFSAQIIDAAGKVVSISLQTKKSPIRAVIPAYKSSGEVYRIQIISTLPQIKSQEMPIRLLQMATGRIEVADGTQTSRIMPGQEAELKVTFTGTAPWSFQLSDSTVVRQTLSNPHYLIVKPAHIKVFKLNGVSNACGSGTASGEAIVNVDDNPEPKLDLKEADKALRLCAGVPFQVPFSATGKYKEGNKFTVQIADRSGNFKDISAPDSSGNITTQIPLSYKPGDYKLRVVSSAPHLISKSANVSILSPATAILMKDSIHLDENQSGELTVKFDGGGPWFVLLSDGTYENNILDTPYKIKIKPIYNTDYQITSAGGLCGVGKFSGSAKVTVKSPPATITMDRLPQNMACSGSTIDIPFKTSGRFNANNKFVVQITDKTGRFVDLPTTMGEGVMNVRLPALASTDTLKSERIRIISSSPAVASAIEDIHIVGANKAVAEVSGRSTIAPGNSTRIQLKFKNGLPPWSFTLSDGSAINGTFLNPYLISVSPSASTEFTITSLRSGCGTGTGRGSAIIKVEN